MSNGSKGKTTRRILSILLCTLMLLSSVPASLLSASAEVAANGDIVFNEPRYELDFNKGWKFSMGNNEAAKYKAFDDSSWKSVDLPHDYSITQAFTTSGTEVESGNLPGGTGWYRKAFNLSNLLSGKRVVLNFDGVYNYAFVYVNGTYVGENRYGYNSFSFDITDLLNYNENAWNLVAVKVVHDLPSSRWYSGSGIYRDVTMTITNPVHVKQYGVQVVTPYLETNSTDGRVLANVTVKNESAQAAQATVKTTLIKYDGTTVNTKTASVSVDANAEQTASIMTDAYTLSANDLWSPSNPKLYTLRTEILLGDEVVDRYDTRFGFRWFNWDANNGFSINGSRIKLNGVCMHHDQGALGAIQERDAIYRQLVILKDLGVNSIRTSHNTASTVLLELCDELGFLVMDEFFDGLDTPKNGNSNDFSRYFNTVIESGNRIMGKETNMKWYEFVVKQTMLRDRNFASVFLWDMANELNQCSNGANFPAITRRVRELVNTYDSYTLPDETNSKVCRMLTQGNNTGALYSGVDEHMDVIGANYKPSYWPTLKNNGTLTKPFVSTETTSAINSRGVYNKITNTTDSTKLLTSYDVHTVGWGNYAADAWYYVAQNDWNSGEYVWTGFDYIGEPTPWNNVSAGSSVTPVSSYFGFVDTAGFHKDSAYMYRSFWKSDSTTLHMLPGTWNRSELVVDSSGFVNVAIYSNAKKVRLYLNGNEIGYATATEHTTTAGHKYLTWQETVTDSQNCQVGSLYSGNGADLYSQFKVKHADGTISVKAFNDADQEITKTVGTKSVKTTQGATKIVSKLWGRDSLTADNASFAYIEFEAQDAEGNFVNGYNGTLTVNVTGEGTIAGVDNGNAATAAKFQQPSVMTDPNRKTATIQMFNGRALAIIRTTNTAGEVNVSCPAIAGINTIQGTTFTTVAPTAAQKSKIFEEVIPQSEHEYTATQYDEYLVLKGEVEALTQVTASNEYRFCSITNSVTNPTASFSPGTMKSDSTGTYDQWSLLFNGVKPTGWTRNDVVWTGVDQAVGQYIQIDLQKLVTIDSINIAAPAHRAATCNADVLISVNGTDWTDVGDYNPYVPDSGGSAVDVTVNFTRQDARYIRLQIKETKSGYWWLLGEVSISNNNQQIPLSSDFLPSGQYILYGVSNNTAKTAKGALLGANHSNHGITCDGNINTPPSATADLWYFDRLSNGKYHVYYYNNGTKYYINLGTTNASLTTSMNSQELTVTLNSNSTITVGNGSQYVNYFGQDTNRVDSWTAGTAMTVYTLSNGVVSQWTKGAVRGAIEDGKYVIYNANAAMSVSSPSTGKLSKVAVTPSGEILTVNSANELTFTSAGGDNYYIQNASGQYLTIGSGNGQLSFSSTQSTVTASINSDGSVRLYKDNQGIDHYTSEGVFSTWTRTASGTAKPNQDMYLYRKPLGVGNDDAAALYAALTEAIAIRPGTYKKTTYDALLLAVRSGIDVYNSTGNPDYISAKNAINQAIAALEIDIAKFPATIYKYGYNTETKSYNGGGSWFNAQALAAMEAAIRANENIMNQIRTNLDLDGTNGTAWGEQSFKDTAINTAVTAYAKIYTLLFSGTYVRGVSGKYEIPYKTCWNFWTKANTAGAEDGGRHEGASVQGLFSASITETGYPKSHTAYNLEGGLPYYNIAPNSQSQSTDVTITVALDLTNTKNITLPPLNQISVYAPDFFTKNAVLSNNNNANEYSKYYWDLDFPFRVVTDEYGINDYVFDSSDTSYVFQAEYNDEQKTAVADLTHVDNWSVRLENAATETNNGFFPFNYKKGVNTFTGENAIYHYGMSFQTNFYIPQGGRYSNNKDIVFNFSGDDDVLVYIDDVLVLDNGGLHGARSCSINFTTKTVSYQYALDVTNGRVISTTENAVNYTYGQNYDFISADNRTAVNKLNDIVGDGQNHTFKFYYLERGSTESNCKISFNLQKVSDYLTLEDQTLVLDYGLPVSFGANDNNIVRCSLCGVRLNPPQENASLNRNCTHRGIDLSYVGVLSGNRKPASNLVFNSAPSGLTEIPAGGLTFRNEGGCGEFTIMPDGVVSYKQDSMVFPKSDSIYLCTKVENDATYSTGTVYYTYEKFTVVPATTIYYEDNFESALGNQGSTIAYTNGTTPTGYDNSSTNFGVWTVATDPSVTAATAQAADLVGSPVANVYGFDPAYAGFAKYSNGSAKYVSVSTKNNPNATYSGGQGGSWPTARFTFAGTGFDVISVTDNTMGAFSVEIYSGTEVKAANKVRSAVVDCFYGYSYGRIYSDTQGNPTRDSSGIPMYLSPTGVFSTKTYYYNTNNELTTSVHYLDISGKGYTATPTYYDENSVLTLEETNTPAYAYAYAYGWLKDGESSNESLYQVPAMKIENLPYGTYTAVITPKFTTIFNHYTETQVGAETIKNYNFCLDAIRVYDPAGNAENISDNVVANAYLTDKEAYSDYFELKNMLIGAESLSAAADQGIIFIDGIASLDNDLDKYKNEGPNNELYLAPNQAIAFEVWATSVPEDLQISAKLVSGSPSFMISYNGNSAETAVNTATDSYISINNLLPVTGKIRWTQLTANGETYYTSGTIVIKNGAAEQSSILSVTNLKWTFSEAGATGYFRIPSADPTMEEVSLRSAKSTVRSAYKMLGMANTATLGITENDVTLDSGTEYAPGESINMTINSSTDVERLVIHDSQGNAIVPDSVESAVAVVDDVKVNSWNVSLKADKPGTYIYTIAGEYEDGSLCNTVPVEVVVSSENGSAAQKTILTKLVGFFNQIRDFFKKLFAALGL